MKIKKRYIITGSFIVIAFLVLGYLMITDRRNYRLFYLQQHHRIPAFPIPSMELSPTDLSQFDEATLHEVRLKGKQIGMVTSDQTIPSVPALKAWVVQLGSFNKKENADRLSQRLEAQGLPAFVIMGLIDTIPRWVVFVGPSLTQEKAQQWQEKIQTTMAIDGLVLPYVLRDGNPTVLQSKQGDQHDSQSAHVN